MRYKTRVSIELNRDQFHFEGSREIDSESTADMLKKAKEAADILSYLTETCVRVSVDVDVPLSRMDTLLRGNR